MFDWIQKLKGIIYIGIFLIILIIVFNYRTQINPITAFNPVQFTEQLDA